MEREHKKWETRYFYTEDFYIRISVLILNILAISKAISGMLLWTQNKRKMSTLVIGQCQTKGSKLGIRACCSQEIHTDILCSYSRLYELFEIEMKRQQAKILINMKRVNELEQLVRKHERER